MTDNVEGKKLLCPLTKENCVTDECALWRSSFFSYSDGMVHDADCEWHQGEKPIRWERRGIWPFRYDAPVLERSCTCDPVFARQGRCGLGGDNDR